MLGVLAQTNSMLSTFYMVFEHKSMIQFITKNDTVNNTKEDRTIELYCAVLI